MKHTRALLLALFLTGPVFAGPTHVYQAARIWTGNVPRSGSYRVDVIGVAPENKSATYRLAINVRDP